MPGATVRDQNKSVVEHWRVFCAIELPEDARERLNRHAAKLREAVPQARVTWSRKENLHLTLKFLAALPVSSVKGLSSATGRAAGAFSSFEIKLAEAGVFPDGRNPRVLWIGVKDETGNLGQLNRSLQNECHKEGLAREERPFHPHLTLGRLRTSHEARSLASAHKSLLFEPAVVAVTELLVIRSELSSAGSRYSVISRHPLAEK